MCFSATASFTAAAIIGATGSLSLSKNKSNKYSPIALTPLFFALQQFSEGFVWLTLNANDSTSFLHHLSVYSFLFFACVFWPIWFPSIFLHSEENPTRRKLLSGTLIFGIFFGLVAILSFLLYDSGRAHISNHSINYDIFTYPLEVTISPTNRFLLHLMFPIYFIGAVLPFFISSLRFVWILGSLITLGAFVSAYSYYDEFGSVWCFFAAIISIATYFIIVDVNKLQR